MKYRIGWPLWKLACKSGCPLTYRYEIFYDISCKRFCAICADIKGLAAEGDTIEEVQDVIEGSAPEFVEFYVYKEERRSSNSIPALFPQMILGRGLVKGDG